MGHQDELGIVLGQHRDGGIRIGLDEDRQQVGEASLAIVGGPTLAGSVVGFVLSGGTVGRTYTVTVTAPTDAGGPPTRIFNRSCQLTVKDR